MDGPTFAAIIVSLQVILLLIGLARGWGDD